MLIINDFYYLTYTVMMPESRRKACLLYVALALTPSPIIGNKGLVRSQGKHRVEMEKITPDAFTHWRL